MVADSAVDVAIAATAAIPVGKEAPQGVNTESGRKAGFFFSEKGMVNGFGVGFEVSGLGVSRFASSKVTH